MPLKDLSGKDAAASVSRDPRLLDQMRDRNCRLGLAMRSETAQTRWTRRFIAFHGKQHPPGMGLPGRKHS